MSNYIQVSTTTPDRQMAESIATALVGARLAACVQISENLTSFYWWQGKTEKTIECLCIVKTTVDRLPETIVKIKAIHSYDVPEIIALPIIGGNSEYLDWIDEETKQTGDR